MRRDSILIFSSSLVLSVLIIGVIYYLNVVRLPQESESTERPTRIISEPVVINPGNQASTPRWTDQPIKCYDEQHGEYWTNARDCESSDLNNRISISQPVQKIDFMTPGADETRQELRAAARASKKDEPSLRQVAQDVPSGLSVSCKFAVGRALEIERPLSAADDPAESIWRENYCKWVKEARSSECKVGGDVFYYGHLCVYGL